MWLPNLDVDNNCHVWRERWGTPRAGNMIVSEGPQLPLCRLCHGPTWNLPRCQKTLLSGRSLYRYTGGNNSGQGTGQQELSSEFCIQNPSQFWHDTGHNVLKITGFRSCKGKCCCGSVYSSKAVLHIARKEIDQMVRGRQKCKIVAKSGM